MCKSFRVVPLLALAFALFLALPSTARAGTDSCANYGFYGGATIFTYPDGASELEKQFWAASECGDILPLDPDNNPSHNCQTEPYESRLTCCKNDRDRCYLNCYSMFSDRPAAHMQCRSYCTGDYSACTEGQNLNIT